ncbi:MAG: kynureninase [Steroidobacteraceae bacterium]|nr:kynureninase [Steroidobacteraceae bacterium]
MSSAAMTLQRAYAEALDAADPLASLRAEFHIPDRAARGAYFCGHSLGLQPKSAAAQVAVELESWARLAVDGHFDSARPWLSCHERLAAPLARLVGAEPLEVVAMNTLTVNLHLMLASFYRPTRERHKILIERRAFSSDRYAVASQIRLHGFDPRTSLLEIGPRESESIVRTQDVCELIERESRQLAVALLPGVQFLTGQLFDMEEIAGAARRNGCIVGFDLAHAAGATPLRLHDWDADFAVWCSYKYLNAGPGSIAGCFVHARHAHAFDLPRLAGWWGHEKTSRFAMPQEFRPLAGAEGWQLSNPPILSLAPLFASLELFDRATLPVLRSKSVRLTGYLESLLRERTSGDLSIITPADPQARGCQLSLGLHRTPNEARAVFDALTRRGFIGDWREPDVIRIAPVPLYNRYVEVWDFVAALCEELRS